MKRKLSLLMALMLSQFLAWGQAKVGQPAPDFAVTDINGKAIRSSDYRGKIVVLESINLDCPFCANHYRTGSMQKLQEAAASKGVVWLVVNSVAKNNPSYRAPDAARKEFAAQNMKAAAWVDDHTGELGKKLGMKTTPHVFVINQQGVLVYQGAIDDRPDSNADPRTARNYVRQAIEALLASRAVPVAETKSYGCAVKYAE